MPKHKQKEKSVTINLRKKPSLFEIMFKKKSTDDEILKCDNCNKKITGTPKFCNQFVTRTRRCNAGPFCSNKCLEEHTKNSTHY
jgi:ribosomal protein L34E